MTGRRLRAAGCVFRRRGASALARGFRLRSELRRRSRRTSWRDECVRWAVRELRIDFMLFAEGEHELSIDGSNVQVRIVLAGG